MNSATRSMMTPSKFQLPDAKAWEMVRKEEIRAAAMEADFLREHAVREFQNTRRNLLFFLKSRGASDLAARSVANAIGEAGPHRGLFEHGQLFGRDGRPTMLVGHPDSADDVDQRLVRRIATLGFRVIVSDQSFRGFGSSMVVVTGSKAGADASDPGPTPEPIKRRSFRGVVWTEEEWREFAYRFRKARAAMRTIPDGFRGRDKTGPGLSDLYLKTLTQIERWAPEIEKQLYLHQPRLLREIRVLVHDPDCPFGANVWNAGILTRAEWAEFSDRVKAIRDELGKLAVSFGSHAGVSKTLRRQMVLGASLSELRRRLSEMASRQHPEWDGAWRIFYGTGSVAPPAIRAGE